MKESRYFQMIYLLLEKGSMTAPALAKHFEVSIRTIYRDIDVLSSAGIPIYTMQGKNGGIFIQDNFVLKNSLLNEQEQKQILMALQGNRLLKEEHTDTLLSKLGGIFQRQSIDWFEIDFSSWTKSGANNKAFQTIKRALFQKKRVLFQYRNGKGESVMRKVEPLKLVFKTSSWYLYGYCCMRKDYRFFKLSRIKKLEISDESYERTTPEHIFTRSDSFAMDTIHVKMHFDKETSFRAYDDFDDEAKEQSDGSIIVETMMPNNELLYQYILSCGNHVEVLSPELVRAEVLRRVQKIITLYET